VDPAVSAAARADATALVAIGQRPTGELDCLFVRAAQLNAPALFHELAELDRLLQPDAILFESNAAFLGLKDLLQQRTSFGSRVVPVVQSRSKASRVASLAVTIETQRFRLRGHGADTHPTQRPLREELLNFPHGARDDLLDAAAMACEYLLARPEPRIF
jgi:phage terminase large subunit-like protein